MILCIELRFALYVSHHGVSISFQLARSLEQAYVISQASKEDIAKLLKSLGNVRALLPVQVAPDEEEILKASIWCVVISRGSPIYTATTFFFFLLPVGIKRSTRITGRR